MTSSPDLTIEAEQFDFKMARQFRVFSYFRGQLSFVTYNIFADENPLILVHSPCVAVSGRSDA